MNHAPVIAEPKEPHVGSFIGRYGLAVFSAIAVAIGLCVVFWLATVGSFSGSFIGGKP